MIFTGTGLALSAGALANAAIALGVKAPEIWAVLSVETHGCGFLADTRPQILFERHVFSKATSHQYDATHPEVSQPTPGGYGATGAHQYDRLAEAIALDETAALGSASWGLAQIMGNNFAAAAFSDVQQMVAAMVESEDRQLQAMVAFLQANHLDAFLVTHDWTAFARGYNGPSYAQNQYDAKLRGYYQQFLVGAMPDLEVRAAQVYLRYLGYDPHGIDGIGGAGTRAALSAFQQDQGLTVTGLVDAETLAALTPVAAIAAPS